MSLLTVSNNKHLCYYLQLFDWTQQICKHLDIVDTRLKHIHKLDTKGIIFFRLKMI